MSFYGRNYGSLVRFPGLAGFGALPSFELPAGQAQELVSAFLSQVPPGSPGGLNARQLIAKARELESQYGDLMKLPQGAEIVGAAKGLEASLATAWQDIVAFANEYSRLAQNNPLDQLAALGPPPGENFLNNFMQNEWNAKRNAILAASKEHTAALTRNNDKLKASLATSLGPKLVDYVRNVSSAAERIRGLEHAVVEQQTAAAAKDTASMQLATKKVAVETKAVEKALQKLENPGVSPLVIAAVAVPVLGVILYSMSKKKSSVAGYRRRSRR